MQPSNKQAKMPDPRMAERFESDIAAENRHRQTDTDPVETKLKQLIDKFDRLTKSGRQERYYIWAQIDLFSKGIHLFSFDPYLGVLEMWDAEDEDIYNPVPLTFYAVEMQAAEYAKSRPHIVPHAESGDRKTRNVLEDLQYLAECLQYEFWLKNPESRQLENKLVILRGGVFCELQFDKTQGRKVQMPVLEMQGKLMVNQGRQNLKTGKVIRKVIDPFNMEICGRSIEESPTAILEEIEFRGKIKKLYPHVVIEDFAPPVHIDGGFSGIHYKKELERFVGNSGEIDQSKSHTINWAEKLTDDLTCVHKKVWFDKWVYEDITLSRPMQLPGTNTLLPEGTRLGDAFDEGLCVCLVNDAIVKLVNEDKNDVLDAYRYTVPGEGFYGPGMSPVISLNKSGDELNSIRLQAAVMSSLGITLVDEDIRDWSNSPGSSVPVADRRNGEHMSDKVHHVVTPGPGPEVAMLQQETKENIIDLSGTRAVNTSGMNGEGMKTATGVNYQNSVANSISSPKLELYSAHCARVITKAVKLLKKNGVEPDYYSKFGDTHGKWIDPLTIPEDVSFRVEEDSHQPRTSEDVKNDSVAAVNLGWGSGRLSPQADEQLGKVFRMPPGAEGYKDWATKAEIRLDRIKEIAAQVEQAMQAGVELATNPVMMIIQMARAMPQPVDNNPMMQRFYLEEIYLSDEFDKGSQLFQAVIIQLIQLHQAGTATQVGEQMAMEKAAIAPAERAGEKG